MTMPPPPEPTPNPGPVAALGPDTLDVDPLDLRGESDPDMSMIEDPPPVVEDPASFGLGG